MDAITGVGHGEKAAEPARLAKAAQEFEAVLLGTLLSSLRQSLGSAPGDTGESGDDDYSFMGVQALATALAARGGLGIAKSVLQQLPGNRK